METRRVPISVFVNTAIEKAISSLPKPVKGDRGLKGDKGDKGDKGLTGPRGPSGKDGITKEVVLDTSTFITEEDLDNKIKELKKTLAQLEADLRTRLSQSKSKVAGGYDANLSVRIAALEAGGDVDLDTVIDTNGTFTYIGKATPGASKASSVWQIKRVEDLGGGDTDIRFADGTSTFSKVWDDRATFVY